MYNGQNAQQYTKYSTYSNFLSGRIKYNVHSQNMVPLITINIKNFIMKYNNVIKNATI